MNGLRNIWEKYSPFFGIIGLIVDTITLAGFLSRNSNLSIEIINVPSTMIVDSNKWLSALSGSLIIIGFIAFCDYLPTLNDYFSGKYLWVGDSGYMYDGGLHSIMYSLAFVMPALLLWLKVFLGFPQDFPLFFVIFISSFVLLFLCSITAFEKLRDKLNVRITVVVSIVIVFFICFGSMDSIPAITASIIITMVIFAYVSIMQLFPDIRIYSVKRRTR